MYPPLSASSTSSQPEQPAEGNSAQINVDSTSAYAQPNAPQWHQPGSYYPQPAATYSYPYPQQGQAATYAGTSYPHPPISHYQTPYLNQGAYAAYPQPYGAQTYYPPPNHGWPSQYPGGPDPSYVHYPPQVLPEHRQPFQPAYVQYPAAPVHLEAQTAGQHQWTTSMPYQQVLTQTAVQSQQPPPQPVALESNQGELAQGQRSPFSHEQESYRAASEGGAVASVDGKQSNKRKRHESPSKERPKVVWVWDLDETLIIFQSLLSGKYADLEGLDEKQKEEGLKLGEDWEKLILDLSDTHMFFEQVEEVDQPSISQVAEFDDGASIENISFEELNIEKPLTDAGKRNLAYLYRHVQGLYAKGASSLLTREKRSEWQALYASTDRFTGGWLSAGRRVLQECSTSSEEEEAKKSRVESSLQSGPAPLEAEEEPSLPEERVIALVSSGQLIPTLTKCLLFRLDPWIEPLNVYSSKNVGKLQCFEWLENRFKGGQSETKFCVIGDGIEEQAAAQMMKWPFFRVASSMDSEMRLPNVKVDKLMDLFSMDKKRS